MAGTMDEFLEAITPETATQADLQITKPEQLNYYEQKVRDFQNQVNAIDTAAYGLRMLLDLNISDDQRLPVLELLSELEQKKSTIRTAAESVNAASALANSVGIQLPKVNIQTQWIGGEGANFAAAVADFAAATGIAIQIDSIGSSHETVLRTRIEGGQPPDLAMLAQPTAVLAYGADGKLTDVSTFMDTAKLVGEHSATVGLITDAAGAIAIPGLTRLWNRVTSRNPRRRTQATSMTERVRTSCASASQTDTLKSRRSRAMSGFNIPRLPFRLSFMGR